MGDNSNQPFFKSASQFRIAKKISKREQKVDTETSISELPKEPLQRILSCSIKKLSDSEDTYYVSQLLKNRGNISSPIMKHFTSSFKILKKFQGIQGANDVQPLHMPQHQRYQNKKTLILDLDQTIIHATKSEDVVCDLRVPMNFPKGKIINAGVNLRPHAMEFLQNLSKYFEIIIFTASHQYYADPILNALDPTGTLFSYRLYRQHCNEIQKDTFAKDLRKIPRSLSQIIMVDNSPVSYLFQPENGIPITSYYSEHDTDLKDLEEYLMKLAYLVDVKNINERTFKLSKYKDFQTVDEVIDFLYSKN